MSFTQVTLAGKYADVQGNPLSGTVSFTLSFPITDGTTIITPSAKSVVLNSTGSFSIVLDATDDSTTSPSGATYTVVESVGSFTRSYAITLSHAQTSQELASIAPAVAGPQQFSYLTTTQATATYVPLAENVYSVAASGSAVTIPASTGANSDTITTVTLTANCLLTFPAPVTGASLLLFLSQDATGGRTVTWPSSVKWPGGVAPSLSAGASKTDVFSFVSRDGNSWFGFANGAGF